MIVGLCVARSSQTATCISMGRSNFISAAVLDISHERRHLSVQTRADLIIGRVHSCTQNPRLSSCGLYCRCMLYVRQMTYDCGGSGASSDNVLEYNR